MTNQEYVERWSNRIEPARGDKDALDALQREAMLAIQDPTERRMVIADITEARNPSREARWTDDPGITADPYPERNLPDDLPVDLA